ncbi:pyrokinin-1 receptor-like [Limulus polyphemus]|uniref:Pyrokinin-1 receptor-like n=1 Tax=Limulus polyphemus TaxID=6850 RepID=A0ABM1B2G9_LIMPO|nr:pyrokinin-1 receptor-like [Limulus polyphemus]
MADIIPRGTESTLYFIPPTDAVLITLIPAVNNESDNESDMNFGPKRDPLSTVIPMTLIYAVILLSGMVGNICTCVVIARNNYMHTATNYYLFSLAVSDLLLLLLGLPQEMYQLWQRYPYVFGEYFCVLRGLTSETSTNASILTITAFTVERYLAICHPLRAHTMSKLSRAIMVIVGIWLLSALCAVPLGIQFGIVQVFCTLKNPLNHAFEISTFLFFIFPMTLITVLYILIGMKLRRSTGLDHSEDNSNNTNGVKSELKQSVKRSTYSSRRAVVKMLAAVVAGFFICWAPFHAQRLMAIYVTEPTPTDHKVYDALNYISGVSYYFSATINPILYSILSLKFRQAFKDTFARCCGCLQRRNSKFNYLSRLNSTYRSTAFETTDVTVVSESPHHTTNIKLRLRQVNGSSAVSPSGQIQETSLNTPAASLQESPGSTDNLKVSNSISNSSLQMLEDDAFDESELSHYMAQMRCQKT